MICTVGFAVMATLAGVISAAIGHAYQMILGLLFIGLGYTLVGPSPFLPFLQQSIGLTLSALILASLGGGLTMVPATPLMISGAVAKGFDAKGCMDVIASLATLAGLKQLKP